MTWFLPGLISAGASLIGNIFNGNSQRDATAKANFETMQNNHNFRQEDRRWYKIDRNNERDWSQRVTKADRHYAEQQRNNERHYAKSVLLDERAYNNKKTWETRAYEKMQTAKDREYMSGQLRDQRAYDQKMYERDVHKYNHDRNLMQERSDKYAKATAASRGIDFVKLRDDAVKAGYNPMTALSMAHAYSTQVDYATQGGVYSPGANYTTSNQGYSPLSASGGGGGGASGGGGAAPGAVIPSMAPAAGNFQTSGSGYQSQSGPALSAGGFIAEAIERGVDQWSNRPVDRDPLADALRNAFQQDEMAKQVQDAQIPKGFGYDLTKQKQFQPAATMGVPALASAKSAIMPTGKFQDGGIDKIPVRGPNNQQLTLDKSIADRIGIEPFGKLMSEDYEALFGEMAGEPVSYYDSPIPYMGNSSLKAVRPTARQKDYSKSGITGGRQFPKGHHFNPYLN